MSPVHIQVGPSVKLRQAEIRHPDAAACIDQQIGRLDIAVNDSQLVGMLRASAA